MKTLFRICPHRRTLTLFFFVTALAAFFLWPLHASAIEDEAYAKTIELYKKSPLASKFLNDSYGYAVFPLVGKGGAGFGGAFGKGRVYRNGQVMGNVSLTQLSIGFQLGGQAYSEIIFFQDKRAYDEFTSGSFEFDATASAVAITAGAQAKVGTTGKSAGASSGPATGKQLAARYVKGLAVFTHAKGGLMYEASLAGQKFYFEKK